MASRHHSRATRSPLSFTETQSGTPDAKIIEAVGGVGALKSCPAPDRIDLILTDVNMPVMDGLKLVSPVRQNARLKNIPIIITERPRKTANAAWASARTRTSRSRSSRRI